ncbi:hypothetical protein JW698_00440 [Candidatus Wolfebacteria bacterium]|nr:hypothetical protein [Candidatus Wolfebacteria bacterium]
MEKEARYGKSNLFSVLLVSSNYRLFLGKGGYGAGCSKKKKASNFFFLLFCVNTGISSC